MNRAGPVFLPAHGRTSDDVPVGGLGVSSSGPSSLRRTARRGPTVGDPLPAVLRQARDVLAHLPLDRETSQGRTVRSTHDHAVHDTYAQTPSAPLRSSRGLWSAYSSSL